MVRFDARMTTQVVSRGADLSQEMGCGDQDMSYLKSDRTDLGTAHGREESRGARGHLA